MLSVLDTSSAAALATASNDFDACTGVYASSAQQPVCAIMIQGASRMRSSQSRYGAIMPRLLTLEGAAHYLGYKSTEILKKLPIKPIRIGSIGSDSALRYDRHEIDRYLDGISGLNVEANTSDNFDEAEALFAEWSRRDAARAA